MIFEGVKLMFVGMGTVFAFLWITVLFIQLVARLTSGLAARELEGIEREKKKIAMARKAKQEKDRKSSALAESDDNDIAAIAAAIACFEADKLRNC